MVAGKLLQDLERPLTEADYWNLPEDGNRYEILGGELYEMPPPSIDHQLAVARLTVVFQEAIDEAGIGIVLPAPTAVRLSAEDLPEPDLLIVSNDRMHLVDGKQVAGAPDLVVEILSPSNRRHDLVKKRVDYQKAGIPEYWIVDTDRRTITILVLEGEQYREAAIESGWARSRRFPTLEVDVARVLRGVPTTPSTTG